MAQLVGTGIDPDGQYPEGHVVDTPQDGPTYKDLIEKGWATADPEVLDSDVNPAAKSEYAISQAIIRGDQLTHPLDRAAVDRLDRDPHTVVASHGGKEWTPGAEDAPATGDQIPHGPGAVDAKPDAPEASEDSKYAALSDAELRDELSSRGGSLESLNGTGSGGAVTRDDVIAHLESQDSEAGSTEPQSQGEQSTEGTE